MDTVSTGENFRMIPDCYELAAGPGNPVKSFIDIVSRSPNDPVRTGEADAAKATV